MAARGELELWTNMSTAQRANPFAMAKRAARLEADGWDGGCVVDSQCLSADSFMSLTLCARETTRLKLGTGVSNAATRHPAVVAGAAATLQVISEGRACLGLGRGDSALAYIGASPQGLAEFERRTAMIQAYLRGDHVPLSEAASSLSGVTPGYEKLALGESLPGSWLKWLPDDLPKVPVDVLATGPKVIGIAARRAERITFAVGADPARLRWAIETARQELERANRDPAQVSFGALLPLLTHHDVKVSRELSVGAVSGTARFSIMNKKIVGPVSDGQRRTLERIASVYDMRTHGEGGAQAGVLDEDFIDGFALVGPPERCIERVQEIVALGFDRLWLSTPMDMGRTGEESYAMSISEVLPRLRAA